MEREDHAILILRRSVGEKIIVGNIEITILEVKPNGSVNIGIKAPKEVKILREELLERGGE